VAGQVTGPVLHVEPPRAAGLELPPGAPAAFARWSPLEAWGVTALAAPLSRQAGRPNPPNVLVLLGLFSDSPEPGFSPADVRRVLFDGPSERGTFVEFYREASRGVVDPGGTVIPWVRTGVTLFEAAGDLNGHGWFGERRLDYVVQTIEAADATVDYGDFDNDGPDGAPNSGDDNGFVDALVIEFLEVAGSCGGPGIWPHFGGLQEEPGVPGWPTADLDPDGQPIRVQVYLTESVADCSGTAIQGPNVIAHEYGHLLGLPDVYQAVEGIEPEKRHWNVGCFGLMAAGSWGCGTGAKSDDFGPVHPSALMKERLGWMTILPVGEVREQTFLLEPAQTTGSGLSVEVEDGTVIFEYRPRIGFDAWLPVGGVLVYHHDPDADARTVPPGLPPAKWYHLIEADGDHALRKVEAAGGNRGTATDAFGLGGRTGPYSGAPGPVPLLGHEGRPMTLTIHSVEVVDEGLARLVLSTAREPAVTAASVSPGARVLEEGELAALRVAGGAPPYQGSVDDPALDGVVAFDGFEATLRGVAWVAGPLEVTVALTDALGTTVDVLVPIQAEGPAGGFEALLDRVLIAGTPFDEPAAYLDGQGNGNGFADVGDLRVYLRRRAGR
jgi:M6 family metalloprotease-like protein